MFQSHDLFVILFLAFLEGILSIDNALVLALLAKPLPLQQQRKALMYGLWGAIVFRLIAVGLASFLIHIRWVKFVGGGYLLWLSIKHFFLTKRDEEHSTSNKVRSFWATVFVIELTDIAFAVDSILAAVALTPKVWLVFTGGFIGVVLMRFAATVFLKLLQRFPGLENAAFVLVAIIGFKVILEGLHIPGLDFHSASSPAFWAFWGMMIAGFGYGFLPVKNTKK